MADPQPNTVVVERGGGATWIIGLAVLIAVIVGAYFVISNQNNETRKTDAISQVAHDVGSSAQKVGDAAKDAANKN